MNSAYKLFITTKNKNWKHTHSVTFPLTHKGLFDAEDLFKSMKEEPSLFLPAFPCLRISVNIF